MSGRSWARPSLWEKRQDDYHLVIAGISKRRPTFKVGILYNHYPGYLGYRDAAKGEKHAAHNCCHLPILWHGEPHPGGQRRNAWALRQLPRNIAADVPHTATAGLRHLRRLSRKLSRAGVDRVLGTLVTALPFIRTVGANNRGKTGRENGRRSDQHPGKPGPGVTLRRARHTGHHASS